MSDSIPSLSITPPQIVPLAAGDSIQAKNNAQGHLFERFMARVFEAYGCDTPRVDSLNIRSNGYELDLSMRIILSSAEAIAECKAYTSNIPSQALTSFYGKLTTERFDRKTLSGWFVAIPGLTPDAFELARKLEANDSQFRLMTSDTIYRFLLDRKWIAGQPPGQGLLSDLAVFLTEHGIFSASKQLDQDTRLPRRVVVWGPSHAELVPAPVVVLVQGSDYANGLPISPLGSVSVPAATPETEPTVVRVVGSSSDLEYQLPASPRFFVGRSGILDILSTKVVHASPQGRVVVYNAQSGWGKSSLALKLAALVRSRQGFSRVFDVRTATSPSYVWMALRLLMVEAEADGLLALPADAAFGSLRSSMDTLSRCGWRRSSSPLLAFFDQFENVFRDTRLTAEFRDLAFAAREQDQPIILGFAWKTDLVGWTERHPYHLRDEIRSIATVLTVEPFGPAEVGTLLSRISKASGVPLSPAIRQRLREYSQGLPWLLKKLCSHIIDQLKAGSKEETLLEESLNVQQLFQQDIANLQPAEVEALKTIADEAPVAVSELVERLPTSLIQSLVDQRLVVKVGEKLDVYWDIFRDFLISGKVEILETYILRLRPSTTSRLLRLVAAAGNDVPVTDAADELRTSQGVIFNASRELRQLGILAPRPGVLALVEPLKKSPLVESDLKARVDAALRRHSVYEAITSGLTHSPAGTMTVEDLSRLLPSIFPAVQAAQKTWWTYAEAFAAWLDYAGLIELRGQTIRTGSGASLISLLSGIGEQRQKTFPQGRPGVALSYLASLLSERDLGGVPDSTIEKSRSDLLVLGLIDEFGKIKDAATASKLTTSDSDSRKAALRSLLASVPGGSASISLIRSRPDARAAEVGELLREAYGLLWAASTVAMAGGKFRAWASAAGIPVSKPTRSRATKRR